MGIETAIAAGAIGSSLIGGALQYGENRAARSRSRTVTDQANQITGAPLPGGGINTGQDSFLQYLRSDPTALKPFQFDASQAYKDLAANDATNIGDQAAALSAGAGSLGARFGTGFASKDALLRSRFAGDIATRNAGIAQSSFNTALSTGMQSFQNTQAYNQQQVLNELQRRSQQLQGLGLGASQPMPGTGALVSQTGGDISTLLTLLNYFGKQGGTPSFGAPAAAPSSSFSLPPGLVSSFAPGPFTLHY